MSELRYTLLSDGSSDTVLMPVLTWLLRQHLPDFAIQGRWADLRLLPNPPKSLIGKIVRSVELYPCQVLFVHRDGERIPYEERKQETLHAFNEAISNLDQVPKQVSVIPIRMQEAWFLFSESAIRAAAGNPNGRVSLTLPPLNTVEQIPDPKYLLHDLLKRASEHRGRRLKDFNPSKHAHRVADQIEDFSPLRTLSAFQELENDIQLLLEESF